MDKLDLDNELMTLLFIPDGKQKSMSIASKIDAKTLATGEAKKKEEEKKGEEDGDKQMSKKELNKLARKQKQAQAKEVAKGGAAEAPISTDDVKVVLPAEVINAPPGDYLQHLNFCEETLRKKQFLNGSAPTSLDKEYCEKLTPH